MDFLGIDMQLKASFTKQGKLAGERNSKIAPMAVEISTSDLLSMRKLKNTDATSYFHKGFPCSNASFIHS